MSLDEIRAETVRMRGFIRAAETQATKILALVDAPVEPTPEPPTEPAPEPPPTDPPVDPPTDPTPPPPTDPGRANNPGLPVIFDESFPYDWNEGMGTPPRWDGMGSGAIAGMSKTVDDPTSPTGRALETTYPPHLSGNGPLTIRKAFGGSFDRVYISWWVKWQAGFDHNSNSEKWLTLNLNSDHRIIFQLHWSNEAIYGIAPAQGYFAGDGSLRANLEPNGLDNKGRPLTPAVDDVWINYELYFERTTGTVRWWRNGVQHAEHVGRSFPKLSEINLDGTWGGGGDKQGTHWRRTGRLTLAVA